MFNGRFWQGPHGHLGTSMYEVDGIVYRIDWKFGVAQVWLNWPRAIHPIREEVRGK